jgi:hypothetical protein
MAPAKRHLFQKTYVEKPHSYTSSVLASEPLVRLKSVVLEKVLDLSFSRLVMSLRDKVDYFVAQ